MSVVDKDAAAPAVHSQAHTPPAGGDSPSWRLLLDSRWRWYEFAFWLCAVASFWVFPKKLMLISEIFILGLLALSIDLVLGFAGLVTLGQGAFFGIGAYAAGLMAQAGAGAAPLADPLLGLLVAALAAGARRLRHELPRAARLRPHAPDGDAGRGADLRGDRRQVQGNHRRQRRPAGRAVIARARPLEFRSLRLHGLLVFAHGDLRDLPVLPQAREFQLRAVAARHQGQPAARPRHRHARQRAPRVDLHDRRRDRGNLRRAARRRRRNSHRPTWPRSIAPPMRC